MFQLLSVETFVSFAKFSLIDLDLTLNETFGTAKKYLRNPSNYKISYLSPSLNTFLTLAGGPFETAIW